MGRCARYLAPQSSPTVLSIFQYINPASINTTINDTQSLQLTQPEFQIQYAHQCLPTAEYPVRVTTQFLFYSFSVELL